MTEKRKRCWSLLTWQPWSMVQYWLLRSGVTVHCDHGAGGILGMITHSEVIGQSRLVLAVQLSIATTSTRYTHTVPRMFECSYCPNSLSHYCRKLYEGILVPMPIYECSIQLHKCSVAITLSQSDLYPQSQCSVFPPSPPRHLLCEELIS